MGTEVLRWADANADGREIEVLVVIGTQATYLVGPLDPCRTRGQYPGRNL